jgi:hypothetical protein
MIVNPGSRLKSQQNRGWSGVETRGRSMEIGWDSNGFGNGWRLRRRCGNGITIDEEGARRYMRCRM